MASTVFSSYVISQPALEEVVVTATRREASVQDIPINITALSSTMIERERLQDLVDIARRVPGLTVIDQGPRSGNTVAIRGLTVDSIDARDQDNNTGGTVATYVGEIPYYVDLRLKDLERVEVLMGPQGTLYGAGTLGGAIRYIPNKPQADELQIEIRGDVYDLSESDDLGYDGGATVNIPLIEDTLAFRASLDYNDDPGFIDYNFLVREAGVSNPQPDFNNPADVAANLRQKKDANTDETLYGRFALRYTSDILDGTLTYYYQDSEIGGRQINHRAAFGTGRYESAHRFTEPNDRKNELYALELVADLGFAELTSATGYGEYTEQGQRDQTDLLLAFEYGYEDFPSFSAFTREDSDQETFTQELRLVSESDSALSWIAGAFYSRFDNEGTSSEFTPNYDLFLLEQGATGQPRPDSLEYFELLDERFEELAAFGELGYQITDAWQVTVGARWFQFDNKQTAGNTTPLIQTVDGDLPPDEIDLITETSDADDDDVIYKFNTSYDITDDAMMFFTLSEGYRLGGVNPGTPCNELNVGQNTCLLPSELLIKSDTTTNYELGWRTVWLDRTLIFNGSLFYVEWDDIRIGSFSENGEIPISTNGGSAETKGLEFSTQWYATPDLSFTANYTFTEGELTEDAPGIVDGADAFDGDRLPGTPEHAAFIAANYGLDLTGGSRLEFDYSMAYISNVLTKVGERDNGEKLDGFEIHNASISWLQDSVTVSLYADNLLDEYAVTGVRRDRSFIRDVGDFELRRYYENMIRPRQVGIRFVYNFEN
ncbi:MAG: TonB-dependent receptor [Pseudomonadota bacterium]